MGFNSANLYVGSFGTKPENVEVPVILERDPTSMDTNYPLGKRWINKANNSEFALTSLSSPMGVMTAVWTLLGQGDEFPPTITGDSGGAISPTDDNWNILGQKNGVIPVMDTIGDPGTSTLYIEDRTSTTSFVVDPSNTAGQRGTYQTIQSAVDAAPAGSIVFIKPGTYTENVTLKNRVDLVAYVNSSLTPTVIINGKVTLSSTGRVSISGICLQTNLNYAISLEGTDNGCAILLIECNIIAKDNDVDPTKNKPAINLSNTGTGSSIRLINCWCRTDTNATNFFTATGTASLTFWNVNVLDNAPNTPQTIPSTFASSGSLLVKYSIIRFPIAMSGTGRISGTDSEFNTFITNSTPLTIECTASGAGLGSYIRGCILLAGNAVALTVNNIPDPPNPDIPVLLNMMNCNVITTAAIPITGTGTIRQCGTCYINGNPIPSSTTLTLTRQAFDPGKLWGNWSGTAPAAGYVGEYISSFIPVNAVAPDPVPVSLTTDVLAVITSITLTPGTYDVSAIVMINGMTTGTYQVAGFGTSNSSIGDDSYGSNAIGATFTTSDGTPKGIGLSIPSFRTNITTNTVFYLKVIAGFSAGSPKAYGRISATRVC